MGMFVGMTQMIFNAELSDRTGHLSIKQQIKATIRSESESTSVADHIAKTMEKKYEKTVKASEKRRRFIGPFMAHFDEAQITCVSSGEQL
jgi:hypothetical protein